MGLAKLLFLWLRTPDARDAPPDTAIAQSPVPSGLKGLECKTAPLALKFQAPPERSPVADAAVADLAPRRSPSRVRTTVPAMRQGPPARPCPLAPWHPPAVPDIARQRSPAHTHPPAVPDTALLRSPAHTHPPVPQRPPALTRPHAPRRPPVPVSSRAVQEAPKLAHRRPQAPLDSSRPSGEMRDKRPRTVPAPAPMRSPTRYDISARRPGWSQVSARALTAAFGLSLQIARACI
ncbi:atherin-like [Palaemon carinicauda]|uniref:atherin-like n=1 Tax=Palaemon carinicauda TaxID=392227 RepID=UPI0035B59491